MVNEHSHYCPFCMVLCRDHDLLVFLFKLDHLEKHNVNGRLSCYDVHIFVQHGVLFLQLD